MSISSVELNFNIAGNSAKLFIEPTSPKPGPTLLTHEMAAVIELMMSRPNVVYTIVPSNTVMI